MILEVVISNFRSVRDEQVLSFYATDVRGGNLGNLAALSGTSYWIPKSIGLYGANGSGYYRRGNIADFECNTVENQRKTAAVELLADHIDCSIAVFPCHSAPLSGAGAAAERTLRNHSSYA